MAIGDKKPVLMKSDIGAPGGTAPAGYATKHYDLGTGAGQGQDLNNIMDDAYSRVQDASIGFFTVDVHESGMDLLGGTWHMTVYRTDADYGRIDLNSYGGSVTRTVRVNRADGSWSQLMWNDPLLYPGKEYCTTECFNEMPVYCTVLTGTSLEGQNDAVLPIAITEGNLVSVEGHVGDYPMPITLASNEARYSNWVHATVQFRCSGIFVGLPYRFVVKYTK